MASYGSTYPVYYPGTVNIGDGLSVAELERLARGGKKKSPNTAKRKQGSPKSNVKKAAAQATARRRTNIAITSLAFAGLGIASLWAVPKFLSQSEPDTANIRTNATLVSIPQASVSHAYVAVAPKAKEAAPVTHNPVLEARSILNAPLTEAERHAKPFVDRMLGNPEMMKLIHAVSATTNTPVPTLMEVIAAETGGRPGNPLQVTQLQFPQLLGAYGSLYAEKMEAYAATLPGDKAQPIRAQAAELRFVSQFAQHKEDKIHFDMRSDLYKNHMHKTLGKKAKFSSLAQRVDKLYQNEYIRTGMQALSNNADKAKIAGLLEGRDPRQILGTDALFRVTNYLGLSRITDMFKHNYRDDLPVIGNLMSEATAKANHVDYHIEKKDVVIKSHGHFKHVLKEIKIPVTIGEMKKTQLEPWNGIEDGIQGQLARERAQRVLRLQDPQPKG